MTSEEANIDRDLIKAQASGEWQKRDYRTLRYVGYAAVEATVEATVSDSRFVWNWSVSTKDKAMPFSGNAPTLDKAIKDAQWHIEQVASVEQQVDVLAHLPSNLQTSDQSPSTKTTSSQTRSCRFQYAHWGENPRKGTRTSVRFREHLWSLCKVTRRNILGITRITHFFFAFPTSDHSCLQYS